MSSYRESAGPSTFRVVSGPQREFIGTSFAVGPRHAVTCRHVTELAGSIGDIRLVGSATVGDIGRLFWCWPQDTYLDVALGSLAEGASDFESWLTPKAIEVQSLDREVICLGYGSGTEGLDSWSDRVGGEDRLYGLVKLQGNIRRGVPGGPVLDETGHAVAINIARRDDGAQKYVLPFRSIYSWLQSQGFSPEGGTGLLSVPIGPPVPYNDVPDAVIWAFSEAFPTAAAARSHIARATELILANNPEGLKRRQLELSVGEQSAFNEPKFFWGDVFMKLSAKSRRSVAALIDAEGAPDPRMLDTETSVALRKFRMYLENPV